MKMKKIKLNWVKMNGLVPTIAQDSKTKEVLMLAYSSKESLCKAVETRQGWYYSRSRNKLWRKGATSGNAQKIKGIAVDCDNDALLFEVEQRGNACCKGTKSCFREVSEPQVLI